MLWEDCSSGRIAALVGLPLWVECRSGRIAVLGGMLVVYEWCWRFHSGECCDPQSIDTSECSSLGRASCSDRL